MTGTFKAYEKRLRELDSESGYMGGQTTINLRRVPALIVVAGSGNSNESIIYTWGSTGAKLIWERNSNSITNLSHNNLVVTFKSSSYAYYGVFY